MAVVSAGVSSAARRAGSLSQLIAMSGAICFARLSVSGRRWVAGDGSIKCASQEQCMPGRGPQTFKKRQKEQERKEKRAEKLARRQQKKTEPEKPGLSDLAPEELNSPAPDEPGGPASSV